MTARTRWISAVTVLLGLLATACGGKGGLTLEQIGKVIEKVPITVVVAPPVNVTPPAPVEPDPPTPEPTPAPEPTPEPERPLVNLNIVVHDAAGAGISSAACAISGATETGEPDTRRADGGGFINFAVRGSVVAGCSAPGYISRAADLPPGDHRFPLEAVAPPEPKPMPAPAAVGVAEACAQALNMNGVAHGCLAAVARTSASYASCERTGDVHVCHQFVREVARALKATTGNPRWGLLRKTKGGDNVDGYGTDVIAFLPERFPLDAVTWQWLGVDVIGGIGRPGARYVGGHFNTVISCDDPAWVPGTWCQRSGDVWAPVP